MFSGLKHSLKSGNQKFFDIGAVLFTVFTMHLAERPDLWSGMKARNVINEIILAMFFAESTEVLEANIKIKYQNLTLLCCKACHRQAPTFGRRA